MKDRRLAEGIPLASVVSHFAIILERSEGSAFKARCRFFVALLLRMTGT
jgi:hypothetical protein